VGGASACEGSVKVFPCAEGWGTDTKAGRGGTVLVVTNLADAGPGSLRAAVEVKEPRTVVFEVSGTIRLSSPLKITSPFLTIAGQTAPSPGITVYNMPVSVRSHDMLIQHVRFRLGDETTENPDTGDTFQMLQSEVYNVVLDHCSFSWGIDETLSLNYEPHDITLSHLIISESLSHAGHPEGEHSKGLLFGNNTRNVVVHRSLESHNVDRNPFIKGGAEVAVVNNVFYNWGKPYGARLGSSDSSQYAIKASIVGNVYIKGKNSPADSHAIALHDKLNSASKVHHADNIAIGVPLYLNEASFDPLVSTPPIWPSQLTVMPGGTVETYIYKNAGARPADRDAIDARIVNETMSRTGFIIDSPKQVGGLPALANNKRAFTPPNNPNADDDADGYTNLEELLHKMAADVEGR